MICASVRVRDYHRDQQRIYLGRWGQLTNSSVLKDDQETRVVLPLDLEPAIDAIILGESALNVLGLELFGEAGKGEDTRYRSRETGKRSSHG